MIKILFLGLYINKLLWTNSFEDMLYQRERQYQIQRPPEVKPKEKLDDIYQLPQKNLESSKTPTIIQRNVSKLAPKLKTGFIHTSLLQMFHPQALQGKMTIEEINTEIKKETENLAKKLKITVVFDENYSLKYNSCTAFTYQILNTERIPLTKEVLQAFFSQHKTPEKLQKEIISFLEQELLDWE